jgi:mono/diheme cytochrome c family protein
MSSQNFRVLSQGDLDALVAYLRSQPSVSTDHEAGTSLTVFAMVMKTLGQLPTKDVPEDSVPPPAVPKGSMAVYGEYLAEFIDCKLCHGDRFGGGTSNVAPRGPNLQPVKFWTEEQFMTTLHTGVTPSGTEFDPDEMPWDGIGRLDDALHEYIKSLPQS